MRLVLLLAAATLCVAGCRETRWKKSPTDAAAVSTAAPKRVADAEAQSDLRSASFDVDEKSGRPRSFLILRLDHFPDPKPGTSSLPSCWRAFPGDFDLGMAFCDGKPEIKVPVFAKNVEQDCYTDPKVERTPAASPLALLGCKKAYVVMHQFEPRMRVDVELRDVN